MDPLILVKYLRLGIKNQVKRLSLSNFDQIQRFLQTYQILNELDHELRPINTGYLKELTTLIDTFKDTKNYYSYLDTFLFLLNWSDSNKEKEIFEISRSKLFNFKGFIYNQPSSKPTKIYLFEDLVFLKWSDDLILRNTVNFKC